MKRKCIFLLLIACAAVPPLFSVPLENLVEPALAARLRSGGGASITETQVKSPVLKLLPAFPELRQFVSGVTAPLDPNVAVETLYLYNKPSSSAEPQDGWSGAQRAALFNQILALSTLTGIQYYSATRKAMRTFYESSAVIDDPQAKNPLPDPVFEQPPESLTLYARQKDLTFGDNIYRYDFVTTGGAFFFTQENITALNAGIIPAVGKNRLQSVFAIIDCGDSLLIYAVSLVKAASVPGMGDRIGNSFSNRAEAVLKWFTGRADSVFFNEES
jgi:hypothetical protein